jgi:glycosyltransferase involved in cell wall biosynthesis
MRIAIDARKLNDFGIGTYLRNLIKYLPTVDPHNEYFLLCYEQDREQIRALAPSFSLVRESAAQYSLREHLSIPAKLRRLRVDLFHTPHYVLPLFIRCRAVVTVHDVIHLLFPQYLPSSLAGRYARFMIRRAVERAELVLTVSNASKRDLLTFFDLDPDKIVVIPNGIDVSIAEPPPVEVLTRVRERYQLTGRFLLFAGNIKPHKNLERLIAAFGQLKAGSDFEDLTLIVIGDEISRYPELRRAVEKYRLRGSVRFFGFVPEPTLVALYQMADVFVFPSLYEGFGLPPLEAMANGTPVVTSNISSLPEVVGDAALTVDPYNIDDIAGAIRQLLTDRQLRARLITDGYERARGFSWERSVAQIHAAYQRALAVPRPSTAPAASR